MGCGVSTDGGGDYVAADDGVQGQGRQYRAASIIEVAPPPPGGEPLPQLTTTASSAGNLPGPSGKNSPSAGPGINSRRKSVALVAIDEGAANTSHVDRKAEDEEDATFIFTDFEVEVTPVKERKKRKTDQDRREEVKEEGTSSAGAAAGGGGTKTFVNTSSRVVQQEDDLDQRIIKTFLKQKNFQWSDFKADDDSNNLFIFSLMDDAKKEEAQEQCVFGDFDVPVFQSDIDAAQSRDRRRRAQRQVGGIRHYTIRSLLGHSARVKCIALAPNERHFVSSSSKDEKITQCEVATGRERLEFTGHEDTIISAKFSADGKYLATTSRDKTLVIWDTVVGKQLFILEHAKIVICCAFSADGRLIVSGCQDRVCRVWSTKKGREQAAFSRHDGIITCASFSPNGEMIVSASSDKTLMLWQTMTGALLATFNQHVGIVLSCSFAVDSNLIVSSDERILHIWDVNDLENPRTALFLAVDDVKGAPAMAEVSAGKKRTWTVASFCPSDFGKYVLAACSDRHVYVLDPSDGSVVLSFFTKATVYCVSVGRTIIMFGDAFGNVYVAELS
eukprot:TRINITY_DN3117_c0_g1_i1.p1 TRINITY_DN3117_c0_g1~~TRINITY_DN3117_c0_g1_i1.p1  ORF type:complete len:559 (-),score=131.07 TRINITY_DN3117_c0_g1_i1:240-1916(-)